MKKITILVIAIFFMSVHKSSPKHVIQNQATLEENTSNSTRNLKELTFSESGYDLGLQHGKQLKTQISEIVKKWKENTSRQLNRNADDVLREFFEYEHFTETIKKWTPHLYEEVRGIADGSGQKFNDIFVLNLLDEFWVYLDNPENHHCSDVGVKSINGSTSYVAQNMDIEEYTDGYQTLIRLNRTKNRPQQLILTHPGLIALNGMNEKGVGVCVNTIMQLKASSNGLPVAFVVRKIIETTDKNELLEFITKVNHASGQNYMIGIRGEIYDFEASANEVAQFEPKNANGSIYHTNHPIVNSDLKEWYSMFSPQSAKSEFSTKYNSYIRQAALEQRLAKNAKVDNHVIAESLRSKDNEKNPVCRENTNTGRGFTFASVIMTLTGTPNLQITAGPPDESEYRTINFIP